MKMTMEEANSALKLFNCHLSRRESYYESKDYIYYISNTDDIAQELGYWSRDDVSEVYKYVVDNYL